VISEVIADGKQERDELEAFRVRAGSRDLKSDHGA
jgi:hypothetical protein